MAALPHSVHRMGIGRHSAFVFLEPLRMAQVLGALQRYCRDDGMFVLWLRAGHRETDRRIPAFCFKFKRGNLEAKCPDPELHFPGCRRGGLHGHPISGYEGVGS